MAFSRSDRVQETATNTGLNPTWQLGGSTTGYLPFIDAQTNASGDSVNYVVVMGSNFEVRKSAALTSGTPNTLSAGTLVSSSNSGSAVNWGAGTKYITQVWTAQEADLAAKTCICIPVSDETTDLTTGTAKLTIPYWPYNFEVDEVYIGVTTAPTGAALQADMNDDATSVFSTNPTIDVSETSSKTAATPPVLTATPLIIAVGSVVTFDIDVVGSTVAGAGLKFFIIGRLV